MTQGILQRIASGDKTAVRECLDTYGGLIWSLARKMLTNLDDAEDAVQEIFIDIWKNAGRFDESRSSETTFVAMIARRRLIDRQRKTQRQPITNSLEDMVGEPSNRADQTMQISIEAKEVTEAMRDLRPEQRKVLRLSIIQGLSHQEISDVLEMPLGTVKTHARRGLLQIREMICGKNDEPSESKEVPAK